MILVEKACLRDIKKIKRFLEGTASTNFYSEFKESVFFYILKKNCFLISLNGKMKGAVIIKKSANILFYIPAASSKCLSFFSLMFILKKYFNLQGFYMDIKYKKLNLNSYRKYFSFNLVNNYKLMHRSLCIPFDEIATKTSQARIRKLQVGKDEGLRVILQNDIFGNTTGRRDLTIDEVLMEEKKQGFLANMCFILEIGDTPSGYGQIVILENGYSLVNFGIISQYRGCGFGHYFLNCILKECWNAGIKNLYLSVDNENKEALALYVKAHFEELSNTVRIIL
jgi:GNAT superfamily N-acetyltransferase